LGSSIDDFMKEEGIFEEAQARAVKGRGASTRRSYEETKTIPAKDRTLKTTGMRHPKLVSTL